MDLLEKEWFIEAPWGKICILAWGDCHNPPVLVCHGGNDCAAGFRPLIRLLPRNFYYIGIELPGNGKSDPFPGGLPIMSYDMVFAVDAVVKHFRWKNFMYIGHSFGGVLNKMYNTCYPDKMLRSVELDPITKYVVIRPEEFDTWYYRTFSAYFENFTSYNLPDNGPRYTREEALEKLMKNRGLTRELAEPILERLIAPAGDGLLRFTIDRRMKIVGTPPMAPDQLKQQFAKIKTPTLTIVFEKSKENGGYDKTPFLFDEATYVHKNCKVIVVPGHHDAHIVHPERMAPYIGQFLMYGLEGLNKSAKL